MTLFQKPALDPVQQLNVLRGRGLSVREPEEALHYLRYTGYFRLMGYSLEFQLTGPGIPKHTFKPGTDFNDILDVYYFDRDLRLVLLRSIHRIEVAFRTCINTTLTERHGTHWYLDAMNFQDPYGHRELLSDVQTEVERSRDPFIEHYRTKYTSPALPPSWMVGEILSFGDWCRAFKNLTVANRKAIASHLGMHEVTCRSWTHSLSVLRNLCAHHAKIYNRVFRVSPKLTAEIPHMDHKANRSLYCQVAVLQAFMKVISPGSDWCDQLNRLISDKKRGVPVTRLGFPEGWARDPFWGLDA